VVVVVVSVVLVVVVLVLVAVMLVVLVVAVVVVLVVLVVVVVVVVVVDAVLSLLLLVATKGSLALVKVVVTLLSVLMERLLVLDVVLLANGEIVVTPTELRAVVVSPMVAAVVPKSATHSDEVISATVLVALAMNVVAGTEEGVLVDVVVGMEVVVPLVFRERVTATVELMAVVAALVATVPLITVLDV
jgi:hypothetical protein